MSNQILTAIGSTISRLFPDATRERTIIIGRNPRMRLLATDLGAAGRPVSLIKVETGATAEAKSSQGVDVIHASSSGEVALVRAGVEAANCLLAATPDGDLNLDLCRIALEKFGVPIAIARLRMFEGVTGWAKVNESGMARLRWNEVVSTILGDQKPSASLSRVANAADFEQVIDVKVLAPSFAGLSISSLPLGECEVVALAREGNPVAAFDVEKLIVGDVVTLIGSKAAIDKVRQSVTSL